jgi:hypothetical protein
MGGTKRRRIPPRRIGAMPAWTQRLIEGEMPEIDTEEHGLMVGWVWLDEIVPGLPPGRSAEGWHIYTRAKEKAGADEA